MNADQSVAVVLKGKDPCNPKGEADGARVVFLWEAVNTYGPQTPRTQQLSTSLRERGFCVDHLVLRRPAPSGWFKEASLENATYIFPAEDDPTCTYEAAINPALEFVRGANVLIGAHENGWSLFGGVALSKSSGIPLVLPLLSDVLGVAKAGQIGNLGYGRFRRSRAAIWSWKEKRRTDSASRARKELERLYVSGAPDVVVFPSRFVRDSLKRRMLPAAGTEFMQFFTPVSEHSIEPILARDDNVSRKSSEEKSVRRVVVIGRISGEKGQAIAIRAHAKVVKRDPHQLVLVGADQSSGRLQGLIDRLGVQGTVERVGHLDEPLTELDAHSALLIPSLSEGAPAILIEAILLNRVPIVSTRVGYAAEYLPAAQLCRPGSVSSLRRAITTLVRGEISLMPDETVHRVAELHSFDRFVDVYVAAITRFAPLNPSLASEHTTASVPTAASVPTTAAGASVPTTAAGASVPTTAAAATGDLSVPTTNLADSATPTAGRRR